MRLVAAAIATSVACLAHAQGAAPSTPADASVAERIEQGVSDATGGAPPPDAGLFAPGDPYFAFGSLSTPEPAAPPDASLEAPGNRARLATPLDEAQIKQRIDKGVTAAGEASAFPPDYAYGAFQRGYFLTAFALALERAQENDPAAQTLLGEILRRGLGVKQDIDAAIDWYTLAAAKGDAEALYALGRMHLDGIGVEPDSAAAADFFRRAADAGQPVAAREFAYLLLQGEGTERNAMLAAAYLRRAAGEGDMDAQFALAGLYAEGVGVVESDEQAARWYAAAARAGHVGAQIEYAILLFNGRGAPKDEAVAARWFRQAAAADNPLAQVRLARLLAEGRGVEKDAEAAARWYFIARARGFRDDYMEDWTIRLDAATREAAEAAAAKWLGLRPQRPVAAGATPEEATGQTVDNTAD
jgi:TPR repeat protein